MIINDVLNQFIVCGHRGFAARYPENTIISFEEAVKAGVDMIELDVGISKDGIPVICHDDTLDRTSDGTGPVSNYTLKELKEFNVAAKCTTWKGVQRMPSFEEFCDWLREYPDTLVNIDMKKDHGPVSDKVADIVERFGYQNRVVFNGLNGKGIARMYDRGFFTEASPDGFYGMMNFECVWSDGVRKLNSICLDANNDVNKEQVEDLLAMGIPVWAWGADDAECVRNLIDCGCTLALCNDPTPCFEVAKELGLR